MLSDPRLSVQANAAARNEVIFHIKKALNLLAQALGIRPPPQTDVLDSMGNVVGKADVDAQYTLDGQLVGALVQSVKGKKLVARSFTLLTPEQRSDLRMR
jgi:hypothetical protein